MALSAHDELILLRKRARRRLVGAIVLVSVSTGVLWNVVGHLPDQQMKPESVEIVSESSGPLPDTALPPVGNASAPAAKAGASAPKATEASAPAVAAGTQLPASLATVEPEDKPKPVVAAPVVGAVAGVAAGAAVAQTVKPNKPAEPPAEPVKKPEPKKTASKPAEHAPAKPAKTEKPAVAEPAKPHKQPDPAAILEGRFDGADAAPTPKKNTANKPEKVDNAASGKPVIQLAALSDPAKADALKAKLSSIGVSAHFSKVQTSKGEVTRVRVGPFASRAEAEAALQKLSHAGVSGIIVNK
ncbi:SPOR domain-containing protein [uncultured Aquitalea sp.]|uniref:SPOR domain-containing protein n=1 Tax=uncultured Aquitalea sp. TaxID=540272 RepID=UPI0025D573A6|nr:SPOR domain-containing protein [uncultured Aquitalea sp.]